MLFSRVVTMQLKICLVATTWFVLSAAGKGPAGTGGVMIPAVDPEIAVAAEYRNFKAEGTREALELFIARHPDHPLADKAREDLRRLGQ